MLNVSNSLIESLQVIVPVGASQYGAIDVLSPFSLAHSSERNMLLSHLRCFLFENILYSLYSHFSITGNFMVLAAYLTGMLSCLTVVLQTRSDYQAKHSYLPS